jgi:hypothetical protein
MRALPDEGWRRALADQLSESQQEDARLEEQAAIAMRDRAQLEAELQKELDSRMQKLRAVLRGIEHQGAAVDQACAASRLDMARIGESGRVRGPRDPRCQCDRRAPAASGRQVGDVAARQRRLRTDNAGGQGARRARAAPFRQSSGRRPQARHLQKADTTAALQRSVQEAER